MPRLTNDPYPKTSEMIGRKYGKLTVLSILRTAAPRGGYRYQAFCKCDCGKTTTPDVIDIKRGNSRSCSCRIADCTRHGDKGSPEYEAWHSMIQRCTNPNYPKWEYWGGRGITVCDEWRKSYLAFLNHIGRKPSKELSLDRIDNNKGYFPGNVRWATWKQQIANRRKYSKRKLRSAIPR